MAVRIIERLLPHDWHLKAAGRLTATSSREVMRDETSAFEDQQTNI